MKQNQRILLLIFLFFTFLIPTGCNPTVSTTPTPFAVPSTATPNIGGARPLRLTLEDVLFNPVAYEGARIQVSGRYKKLPVRVCEGERFDSPASWSLTDGERIVLLDGFESQIRQLLPEQLNMEVSGVWRRWSGPIGCGKNAIRSEVFYLDVRTIISPNPVTAVTLTPSGEEVADTTFPTSTSNDDDEIQSTPEGEATEPPDIVVLPTASQTPTLVAPDNDTGPTVTPTASGTPDFEEGDGEETTGTATATVTGTVNPSSSATPTSAPGGSGATATPTGTAAPTLSPNVATLDQGALGDSELGFETLSNDTAHSWAVSLDMGDVVTFTAVMPPDKNPVLSLKSPAGDPLILLQNTDGVGEPEVIAAFQVPSSGVYSIDVLAASLQATTYIINFYVQGGPQAYLFQPVLDDSESISNIVLPEEKDHFWAFYAEKGESITFDVEPNENADLFITLFGKNGELADSDEPSEGAIESITYTVAEDGIYALQVGDWDWLRRTYNLEFTRD